MRLILSCCIFLSLIPNAAAQDLVHHNKIPVGVSSFALGVDGFPLYNNGNKASFFDVATSVEYIATNELLDFPEKPDQDNAYQFLKELRKTCRQDEILIPEIRCKRVFHQIIIINGAGARKGASRFINSLFKGKRTRPSTFKKALLTSQPVRDSVLNKFVEVVRYARSLEDLGIDVVIMPELEDNQSQESFKVLVDLLSKAGWSNEDGTPDYRKIVRSTVVRGERERSGYVRREIHSPSVSSLLKGSYKLRRGDIINLDGKTVSFKKRSSNYYSYSDVAKIVKYCQANGIIFYIWYAPLQGFKDFKNSGSSRKYYGSYFDRDYILDYPYKLISLLKES